ncbi:MAG: efflux RND transporter permease subunit [Planctomycetota bacterium]
MKNKHYIAISLVSLAAMLAALPWVVRGADRSVADMFNAPILWVPPHFEARREFSEFVDQFRAQEMILISWPGCTVDDERLLRLGQALRDPLQDDQRQVFSRLFSRVRTGYEVLRAMTEEPSGFSRAEALRRLWGTFVGPDGERSCCVVFLTPAGSIDRRQSLEIVLSTAERVVELPRSSFRVTGPPVDGIAIDDESIRSIEWYAIPSGIISFIVCCICLRSLWLTLPVIAVAAFGEGAMLASVHASGATMNAILIVLPPLVYVLTVSAGVHLVNYYFESLKQCSPDAAPTNALRKGWLPCFLAAATTAIGLASLMVSNVEPVRQFGALATAGVLGTFVLLLLLLPGAMAFWPVLLRWLHREHGVEHRAADYAWAERIWAWCADVLGRWCGPLTAGTFAVMILSGVGLYWLRTSVNATNLLLPDNPAMQDFHWFEENLGPMVPLEIVLHFPRDAPIDLLDRVALVRGVHDTLREIDLVGGVMSAATFVPDIPSGRDVRSTTRRAVLRRRLESQLDQLVAAGYLSEGENRQSWRVSGRVVGRADIEYSDFLKHVAAHIDPVVERSRREETTPITVTYTGVAPVVEEAQRALLADLFYSYLTALGLVTVVMMIVLRSARAGLAAMIPNFFPTVVLFGLMGWSGTAVDIGAVMTASVALGMAVDGTLHFLNWFRREVATGNPRLEAVRFAYRHCGRALAQTTLICALGLLVYAFSGFLPARNFSWMMLVLLILAAIGDLVVLPALLLSPMGWWFLARDTVAGEAERAPASEEPVCAG